MTLLWLFYPFSFYLGCNWDSNIMVHFFIQQWLSTYKCSDGLTDSPGLISAGNYNNSTCSFGKSHKPLGGSESACCCLCQRQLYVTKMNFFVRLNVFICKDRFINYGILDSGNTYGIQVTLKGSKVLCKRKT